MARATDPIIVSPKYPHAKLGRRIQSARLRAGLTQEKLAEAAGITRRQIIRLEAGEHRPSDVVFGRIVTATGQPLSFFTGSPRAGHLSASGEQEAAIAASPFRGVGARAGTDDRAGRGADDAAA